MLARLHPDESAELFERELAQWTSLPEPYFCFLAVSDAGEPIGMVAARVRNYAEGAPNLQAPYLEDLWVAPGHRRRGVARALLAAIEEWARQQGYGWLGSDALIDNLDSHRWHSAAGFAEVERLVVFGKDLG